MNAAYKRAMDAITLPESADDAIRRELAFAARSGQNYTGLAPKPRKPRVLPLAAAALALVLLGALAWRLLGAAGAQDDQSIQLTTEQQSLYYYQDVIYNGSRRIDILGYPKTGMAYGLEAREQVFTEQQISELLQRLGKRQNGVSLTRRAYRKDAQDRVTGATCEDGSYVTIQPMEAGIPTGYLSYVTPEYEKYSSCYYWYREPDTIQKSYFYFASSLWTMEDLSFATVDEAEQEIRQILAALDLRDLQRTMFASLTTATLKKFQTQGVHADPSVEWTQEDEVYYFEFAQPLGALHPVEFSTADLSMNTTVTVWYGKNGVLFLDVPAPLEQTKPLQAPQTLLTAREALEKITLEENETIRDLRMVYAAQYSADTDTYTLTPAWSTWVYTRTTEGSSSTLTASPRPRLLNAITGEPIFD